MDLELLVIIMAGGFILFFLELFLIPGFTVFGVLGGLLIIAGLVLVYTQYGSTTGNFAFLGSLAICGGTTWLALRYFRKSELGLQEVSDSQLQRASHKGVYVGDQGIAFGDLRPMGRAHIHQKVYNVISEGGHISDGTPLSVIRIESDKIIVAALQ